MTCSTEHLDGKPREAVALATYDDGASYFPVCGDCAQSLKAMQWDVQPMLPQALASNAAMAIEGEG